jgi:phosphatidylglycerophosphatase A
VGHIGKLGPLPKMPGTWGSFAATLAAPLLFLPLPPLGRALALAAVLAVGVAACSSAERKYASKDPGCVVIDELWGQWIALLPLTTASPWWLMGVAFFAFRVFDVLKPWPACQLDRSVPGGLGVMLDDGAAGLYAMLCVWLLA